MGTLDKLETTLDDMLDKKAPVKLPEDVRKAIAGALWWIALIGGVLQLWAAYQIWHWGHRASQVFDAVYRYTGQDYDLGFFYYVSLLSLAAVGVMFLLATPALKNMKKKGWDWLFYATILEAVVAVARLFVDGSLGGGFGNFLMTGVVMVVSAYILFQVRGHFMMSRKSEPKAPVAKKK